jgi:acyl-CoA synthetase (AMP-forming)/AMP-acid ligase II
VAPIKGAREHPIQAQLAQSDHPATFPRPVLGGRGACRRRDEPEATAEKVRDGWLHIGNMTIKDRKGYVRITGRLTDMIIRGAFNTYPAEIEDFFFPCHPKVLDVSPSLACPIQAEGVRGREVPPEGARVTETDRRKLAGQE